MNNITTEVIHPTVLNHDDQEVLAKEIYHVIKESWAEFSIEFINSHIISCDAIILARNGGKIVGFCAVTDKYICNKRISYVEFTAILPQYQNKKVGPAITLIALREKIFKRWFEFLLGKFELMFITPNIRVLATIAKYSSFIYPNPYLADDVEYKIADADNETWAMACQLIQKSDQPHRHIDRNGLVLHGSYAQTPWQIVRGNNIRWHNNDKVNNFAKRYLKYGKCEDREFIVRARFGVRGLTCFLFPKIFCTGGKK